MKTNTIYVEVPCSERLPKLNEWVITDFGIAIFDGEYWADPKGFVFNPKWWLEKREDVIVMTKEELELQARNAFSAGEEWSSECDCGGCDCCEMNMPKAKNIDQYLRDGCKS